MSLLITAVCMVGNLSIAATIPTAPSVTFGSVSDANTLNSTQFNKYDGSVFVKTSDGTANGAVESVWHYSIKNNKWVKVPVAEWGKISGTLSDQTDLQNALNLKANASAISSVGFSGSYLDLTGKPTLTNGTVTNVSASLPLSIANPSTTPLISIATANSSTTGVLNSTDWQIFNAKQQAFSLTTTGSGSASFVSNVLNIPTPTPSSIGAESVVTGGTNLQYWRGDKTWQTLNTLVVPESTNLYFTDTRARSSLSAGTGISYNNSTGVISSIVPIMQRFSLASAFSSTSVTQAAVTGWSFPVTTGKSYRIEIIATYQTDATTTGGAMGFVLIGGGAGTIAGELEAKITSTSTASDMKQSIYTINTTTDTTGSTLTTKGVGTINQPHHIGGHLIFNCTTSGTFQVNYATEVAASASQLNAGSVLFVTEF